MVFTIVLLIFFAAGITFSLVPLTIILAKHFGLTDNPLVRPHPAHTHKGIIPRAGGLPIFLGIIIPAFILTPVNNELLGITIGGAILVTVGLWDDKKHRSPYIRLFTNALAVIAVVAAGVNIPYITNPFGGILPLYQWKLNFLLMGTGFSLPVFSIIIAFIWIYWMTNIIGWSGGVDGQLPGFVAISAFAIGQLSLRFAVQDQNQLQVAFLSFLTAGAFLGFLPWNFHPQKIMPGYGGKTLAGFMLAIISILSFSKLGTAILVLAVPITDAFFMVINRIISGRSPLFATSGHLHHHLLLLGWEKRRIAALYWIISAIAGVIAVSLNSRQKIFAILIFIVIISGFILWLNLIKKIPSKKEGDNF